jgi:hypothetical protein
MNDNRFKGLLISMSFLNDSISSIAVLQSLYALAALHLYGPEVAMPFKAKAAKSLVKSSQFKLGPVEGLQHIAAQLLVSLFKVKYFEAFLLDMILI